MKFDRRTSLLWLALTLLGCDAGNETRPSTTPGDTATTAVPDWVKNATEHPAGFHYAVLKEGEGTSPTLGSIVTFHCTCTANGKEVVDTAGLQAQTRSRGTKETPIAGGWLHRLKQRLLG